MILADDRINLQITKPPFGFNCCIPVMNGFSWPGSKFSVSLAAMEPSFSFAVLPPEIGVEGSSLCFITVDKLIDGFYGNA
jgi:hypothetical protein